MKRSRCVFLAVLVSATPLMVWPAAADTIATFADPSDGTRPVFTFTSDGTTGVLSGGWSDAGLRLECPGLNGDPEYPDAKFSMERVRATRLSRELWSLGSGVIDFFDKSDQFLFRIEFGSGLLLTPQGFGGSDFSENGVRFSGPIVPDGLFDEAFSFSFANPIGDFENYTVTSSFTSSAVPEPASLSVLLIGALGALRRRG